MPWGVELGLHKLCDSLDHTDSENIAALWAERFRILHISHHIQTSAANLHICSPVVRVVDSEYIDHDTCIKQNAAVCNTSQWQGDEYASALDNWSADLSVPILS